MRLAPLHLFTSQTSIHGVRYTNESDTHRAIRLFWLATFVLSIVGLSFYARASYVKWKITPDLSMSERLKPIREIPFPAVTICSPVSAKNAFANYQNALAHVLYENHTHLGELSGEEQRTISAIVQACDPTLAATFASQMRDSASEDLVSHLERASFETSEALFLCLLANDAKQNCTELMNRIVTDYGICYAYNMQDYHSIFNERVLSTDFDLFRRGRPEAAEWTLGSGYVTDAEHAHPARIVNDKGVEFVLRLPRRETHNNCPQLRNSYKVFFHMPNEMPTKFHDYVYASVGTQFFISMGAKFYTRDDALRGYSPEMRGCYFEGERRLMFFSAYTKAHCDLECLTNFTLGRCGCVKFSMPRTSATPVCDLIDVACYSAALRSWPQEDENWANSSMPCGCLPPCNDIRYRTELIDHIDIDDSFMREVTMRNKETNNSEIFTAIMIVFEDFLVKQQVVSVAYKWQNFVADIGGLPGLFMGCSLLSIVELFYLCFRGFVAMLDTRVERVRFLR